MVKRQKIQRYCKCGCGEYTKSYSNRFLLGHNLQHPFGEESWRAKSRKYPKPTLNHHLCECGCNILVASNKRFVSGHHNRYPSPELVAWRKEYSNRPEVKAAVSKVHKGKIIPRDSVEKQIVSAKKTNATLETKARRSEAHKRENISLETRRKMSASIKLSNSKPEVKKKRSDSIKKLWQDESFRDRMMKILTQTTDHKRRACSVASKGFWQDFNYVEKQRLSRAIRPNKPETYILNLLDELYPNQWRYTGDFSFIIGGKNPDFVNINGQKKCIEFNGDYWHQGDNPQERIDHFKQYGWNTLILWNEDIRDELKLKQALAKFVEI